MAEHDNKITLNFLGKSVSIEGIGTIFIVVILAFASGLGYMLYDLSLAASNAVKEAVVVQRQTAAEHTVLMETAKLLQQTQVIIGESVKQVDASVKTQNWILLADPDEKKEVKKKIGMPKELREMGMREK